MLLIFLDQETTGLDPKKHVVLDIAFKIVDAATNQLLLEYETLVKQPFEVWANRDPISMEINGITWEQILSGKELSLIREEIIHLFVQKKIERGKAVFICQNPGFDRAFFAQLVDVYTHEKLQWPYHWLDFASMYWATQVKHCQVKNIPFPLEINLSKDEIAKYYQLPIEIKPHRAMNGVNHLMLLYEKLFQGEK